MTDFTKFSPNPSIMPFTNGMSTLIDSGETKDQERVLTQHVVKHGEGHRPVVPWLAARVVFLVAVVVAGDAREGCCSGARVRGMTWTGTKMSAMRAGFPVAANPLDRASLPQPPAEQG
jgi:hypothetical protein